MCEAQGRGLEVCEVEVRGRDQVCVRLKGEGGGLGVCEAQWRGSEQVCEAQGRELRTRGV